MKWATVTIAFGALVASLLLFTKLGAEFIPTLDEGDFAMQMTLPAGSSLTESIRLTNEAERILTTKFHVNGMGDQEFSAVVVSIGQNVSQTNRSVEIYARITKNNPDFRPGLYVTARFLKNK